MDEKALIQTMEAMHTGMGGICAALAVQMQPDAARQFVLTLRSLAQARKNAGDTKAEKLLLDLASAAQAMRPETFGH